MAGMDGAQCAPSVLLDRIGWVVSAGIGGAGWRGTGITGKGEQFAHCGRRQGGSVGWAGRGEIREGSGRDQGGIRVGGCGAAWRGKRGRAWMPGIIGLS